jgi:hypothetical protein
MPFPASSLADVADATDRDGWLAAVEELTEEEGYIQPLGPKHWAFFVDEGPTLLVTFETMDSVRGRPGQMPFGHDVATRNGWSQLCMISDGDTWFRDEAVYRFFDRQVDDAFFEDFDRVLFYGVGMGGYAACAYALTAPGAQVLALSPHATQNPDQASWDHRYPDARLMDFTSRYGYAPDMTDGCDRVTLILDPTVDEDAMHAALFRAPWVTRLSTRYLGDRVEPALLRLGVLPDFIEMAMAGTLAETSFGQRWRGRRSFGPYLGNLLDRVESKGRRKLAIAACKSVVSRLRAPRFLHRLERLMFAGDPKDAPTAVRDDVSQDAD